MGKKFSSLLLLFLLFSTHSLCALNIKNFFSNSIDNFKISAASISSLFCDCYQFKILGSDDVSQKTKNLVHGILRELGINRYNQIHVKQMSQFIANNIGKNNAIATSNAIFIDEEHLTSLSSNEQRAVIGHEGIHIKNKDVVRTLIALGLMDITGMASFSWTEKNIKNTFARYGCNASIFVTLLFLTNAFRRCQEQCADQQSAKLLQCREGGIALNRKFVKKQSIKPRKSYSYVLGLKKWFTKKLSTYPLPEERIAYLTRTIK